MFLPNTNIVLATEAALRLDLAEGSEADISQVLSSSTSVESRKPKSVFPPPVTRSTCKIMMMYLLQTNVKKTHSDSLIIHKLTTGVPVTTNIEIRQSLWFFFLAVFGHFFQSPAWCRDVKSSCYDVGVVFLDTTRSTVIIL